MKISINRDKCLVKLSFSFSQFRELCNVFDCSSSSLFREWNKSRDCNFLVASAFARLLYSEFLPILDILSNDKK